MNSGCLQVLGVKDVKPISSLNTNTLISTRNSTSLSLLSTLRLDAGRGLSKPNPIDSLFSHFVFFFGSPLFLFVSPPFSQTIPEPRVTKSVSAELLLSSRECMSDEKCEKEELFNRRELGVAV